MARGECHGVVIRPDGRALDQGQSATARRWSGTYRRRYGGWPKRGIGARRRWSGPGAALRRGRRRGRAGSSGDDQPVAGRKATAVSRWTGCRPAAGPPSASGGHSFRRTSTRTTSKSGRRRKREELEERLGIEAETALRGGIRSRIIVGRVAAACGGVAEQAGGSGHARGIAPAELRAVAALERMPVRSSYWGDYGRWRVR